MHNAIVKKLGVRFENVLLDGRLLSEAQERVNLASKVVAAESVQNKCQHDNAWLQQMAKDMDVDIDEDMMEEGLEGGTQRERNRLRESKKAKARLTRLLQQPLQTQRFGKFLSTNGRAAAMLASRRKA